MSLSPDSKQNGRHVPGLEVCARFRRSEWLFSGIQGWQELSLPGGLCGPYVAAEALALVIRKPIAVLEATDGLISGNLFDPVCNGKRRDCNVPPAWCSLCWFRCNVLVLVDILRSFWVHDCGWL